MIELTINTEFQSLIPPLTREEYSILKQSIDEEGCRESIMVWNGTIIDGHNRYQICKELDVEFSTDLADFSSEDEARLWIINNQLGRRNLQDFQKAELVSKRKDILLKKGKENLKTPTGSRAGLTLSSNDKVIHNTQSKLAKEAGMSTGKFAQAEQLIKEAPEELKQELREGTKKIGEAYRELKESKPIVQTKKESSKPVFNVTNDNIEWAKYSWNPVTGCLHNCSYCYARDIANRFTGHFEPEFHENRLQAPFNTEPKDTNLVFLCSMADLFGEWVPADWINKVMDVVRQTPQWTYLCLTKNPKRYLEFDFPKNVWLGITTDTNKRYHEAVKIAQDLQAKAGSTSHIIFVSMEPLKEAIDMNNMPFDWVIVGGQSKTTGEPEFQPEWKWVQDIIIKAGNKCYFKPNLKTRPMYIPGR
jgi:protein gp37